ncbi:hypothetical protein [Streptomyces sp. KL116D]|uniref:hypothetical protein n=1 Tax=Streptomyces sp. KL116D TaxID=3045152 RepID=UPI003556BA10
MLTRPGVGKPLAVVCHGPAALLAATKADGTNSFKGLRRGRVHQRGGTQGGFADKANGCSRTVSPRPECASGPARRGRRRWSSTATWSPARTRPPPPPLADELLKLV